MITKEQAQAKLDKCGAPNCRAPECALATLRVAEKELSDAYLRIREKLGAWGTSHGGADRFAVTEAAVDALLAQVGRLTEALDKAQRALKPFADRVFNDNGDCTISDTHTLTPPDY